MSADFEELPLVGQAERMAHQFMEIRGFERDEEHYHERLGLLIDAYHEYLSGNVRRPDGTKA